jgi:glutathione synthase/RimK-type ligase-like ATP-grasp enzyme
MARILIITRPHDLHAATVSAALKHNGHEVVSFSLDHFPLAQLHSLEPAREAIHFRTSGGELAFDSGGAPFDTVWFRRMGMANQDDVQLDDDDSRFVGATRQMYSFWLYAAFESFPSVRNACWINPVFTHGENKLIQLQRAAAFGLTIPPTLISNDPAELTEFRRAAGGPVACKSLIPADGWSTPGGAPLVAVTAVLPPERSLPEASVRLAPAIYQHLVPKQYEVRTLFLGDRHFSVRIDKASPDPTLVDWRADFNARFRAYQLPESIAGPCRELMRELSLRFACFDFIRRPDGEYVFLELNAAGQFLFMEDRVPEIPVLSAFCHFLVHHDLSDWRDQGHRLPLASVGDWPDVRASVMAAKRAQQEGLEAGKRVRVY